MSRKRKQSPEVNQPPKRPRERTRRRFLAEVAALEQRPLFAMAPMGLSVSGLNFVASHELGPPSQQEQTGAFQATPTGPSGGFASTAYTDPAGIETIGYGDRLQLDPTRGAGINQAQADVSLSASMGPAVVAVNNDVKVALTQNQFNALADFAYNEGTNNFAKSSVLKDVNSGYLVQVPTDLDKWVYGNVNGSQQVIPGLVDRRNDESNLFQGNTNQDESGEGPDTGFSSGHPGNTAAGHDGAGDEGSSSSGFGGYTTYDGYSPNNGAPLGSTPYGESTSVNGSSAPYGTSPFGYSSTSGLSPFSNYYGVTSSASLGFGSSGYTTSHFGSSTGLPGSSSSYGGGSSSYGGGSSSYGGGSSSYGGGSSSYGGGSSSSSFSSSFVARNRGLPGNGNGNGTGNAYTGALYDGVSAYGGANAAASNAASAYGSPSAAQGARGADGGGLDLMQVAAQGGGGLSNGGAGGGRTADGGYGTAARSADSAGILSAGVYWDQPTKSPASADASDLVVAKATPSVTEPLVELKASATTPTDAENNANRPASGGSQVSPEFTELGVIDPANPLAPQSPNNPQPGHPDTSRDTAPTDDRSEAPAGDTGTEHTLVSDPDLGVIPTDSSEPLPAGHGVSHDFMSAGVDPSHGESIASAQAASSTTARGDSAAGADSETPHSLGGAPALSVDALAATDGGLKSGPESAQSDGHGSAPAGADTGVEDSVTNTSPEHAAAVGDPVDPAIMTAFLAGHPAVGLAGPVDSRGHPG